MGNSQSILVPPAFWIDLFWTMMMSLKIPLMMMTPHRIITKVWHMAHFWVSYGRCTMPGSPMGRSEGSSRCWAG